MFVETAQKGMEKYNAYSKECCPDCKCIKQDGAVPVVFTTRQKIKLDDAFPGDGTPSVPVFGSFKLVTERTKGICIRKTEYEKSVSKIPKEIMEKLEQLNKC